MTTNTTAAGRRYWPKTGLASVFAFAAGSNRRAVALLFAVSLVMFLPGFFQLPPLDRDESRFAQATKQMLETGDYVDIRYQDEVRYKKPVGIYWLQAAAVKTAGALGVADAHNTIWLYRIPSLVGAIGAVLATYWAALGFVSRRGAMLAALMMAASPLLGVEARMATTDAVLLLTSVTAMGALGRGYLAARKADGRPLSWGLLAVLWTAVAVGILIKGPLILMFVGLTALAISILDRSARWLLTLGPLLGIAWVLIVALPWFVAIYLRVGSEFFVDSVGTDLLSKVSNSMESHGAPPGTYFLLFFATFFPASILAGLAAPAVWSVRREPAARFLLAWLVPSWIVFELVVTKLPHYVLPLYPAIAILIAGAVESNVLSQRPWLKRGTAWWFVAPILLSVATVVASVIAARDLALPAWPLFAAAIVCGLFAWLLYEQDGAERSFLRAAASMALIAIAFYGLLVPWLTPVFPSVALANVLRNADCKEPVAASAGYEEPSLVFLAGTTTRLTDASAAADFLGQGDCHFAFIDARQERAFARRAQALDLRYNRKPHVTGFNISNGQSVTIEVFQSAGAP